MGALIEWAVAARPLRSESVSGDQYLVKPFAHGVLVAVIDGLGHGPNAHKAATTAVAALASAADSPLELLIKECHSQMFSTRGAALTLASFTALDQQVRWMGVGNVEAVLVRSDARAIPSHHPLTLRGGVVGYRLPDLRESTLPLAFDDLLLFATDGVSIDFLQSAWSGAPPQEIANELLARYENPRDDALVLAVRWKGD